MNQWNVLTMKQVRTKQVNYLLRFVQCDADDVTLTIRYGPQYTLRTPHLQHAQLSACKIIKVKKMY